MKKLVVFGLCAALVAGSIQQAKSWNLLYVCYVGASTVIAGVTYFMVKSCKPKYYCMTDADGNRFYSNATRTEREVNDWEVTGGPYDSAEEAAAGCVVTAPAVAAAGETQAADAGVFIPAVALTIWKSTNAVNWVVADRIIDDPQHFSWRDTNAISANAQMFYRVTLQ
jgi:hypothetical protein